MVSSSSLCFNSSRLLRSFDSSATFPHPSSAPVFDHFPFPPAGASSPPPHSPRLPPPPRTGDILPKRESEVARLSSHELGRASREHTPKQPRMPTRVKSANSATCLCPSSSLSPIKTSRACGREHARATYACACVGARSREANPHRGARPCGSVAAAAATFGSPHAPGSAPAAAKASPRPHFRQR